MARIYFEQLASGAGEEVGFNWAFRPQQLPVLILADDQAIRQRLGHSQEPT